MLVVIVLTGCRINDFRLLSEGLHAVHGETVSCLDLVEYLLHLGEGGVAEGAVLQFGQDILELGSLRGGRSVSGVGGGVLVAEFIQDFLELVHGAQVAQDVWHSVERTVVDVGQNVLDFVASHVDFGSGFGVGVVPGTSLQFQEYRQEARMELALLVFTLFHTLHGFRLFEALHGEDQRRSTQNLKQRDNVELMVGWWNLETNHGHKIIQDVLVVPHPFLTFDWLHKMKNHQI